MIQNFIFNYFIKKVMPGKFLFLAEWQTDILNPLLFIKQFIFILH